MEEKVQKFMGRSNESYAMWRFRLVTMLKGKGYWVDIREKDCSSEIKTKATNIIVSALGDVSLSVCMDAGDSPLSTIELLGARFASTSTSSLFAVISTLLGKRHNGKEDMAQYIDEFQQLFTQLDRMGSNGISEKFKVPLLLFSIGHNSVLEHTIAAFRTRDIKALKWTDVISDLIAEWKTVRKEKSSQTSSGFKPKTGPMAGTGTTKKSASNTTIVRDFCGKKGHTAQRRNINPSSPNCRLSDKTKKALQTSTSKEKEDENGKITFCWNCNDIKNCNNWQFNLIFFRLIPSLQ